MNLKYLQEILEKLPKNAKILDAGCGSGNVTKIIKNIRSDVEIYGVDLQKNKKLPKFIKFRKVSIENLNIFKNDYFDAVFCFHVLEHLKRPETAIQEFKRILKPNGSLVV